MGSFIKNEIIFYLDSQRSRGGVQVNISSIVSYVGLKVLF